MKTLLLLAVFSYFALSVSYADDPGERARTTATYAIGGLHCPPCTRTVESSLARTKGVKSAKVDWATKSAKIQFDENVISAAGVAGAVAHTPHMMGAKMQYSGTLLLSVPAIQDNKTGKTATGALESLPGVTKVIASPANHTVSVQFTDRAKLTSAQLIDALDQIGMKGKTY